MSNTITTSILTVLTDLVESARTTATEARALDRDLSGDTLDSIAHTLDAARTRLVEDGPGYLLAAEAFMNEGRRMIARHRLIIDRARDERAALAELGLYR